LIDNVTVQGNIELPALFSSPCSQVSRGPTVSEAYTWP
jgi:hypothetical protein